MNATSERYFRTPSTCHESAHGVASRPDREAGAGLRAMPGCTREKTHPATGTSLQVPASVRRRSECRRELAPRRSPRAVRWYRSASHSRDATPGIAPRAAAATCPRRGHGDAHRDPRAPRLKAFEGHGQAVEAGLQIGKRCACLIGQNEARRPGLSAVKELDPEHLFETAHELADGRGRHVQLIGSRDIAEMSSRRLERAQGIQVIGRSHESTTKFLYSGRTDHLCCGFERQRSWSRLRNARSGHETNFRTRRMDMKLSNKIVLVTGGTSGIGL